MTANGNDPGQASSAPRQYVGTDPRAGSTRPGSKILWVIVAIVAIILVISAINFIGLVSFLNNQPTRSVDITIVCTACSTGPGFNGDPYEFSFQWNVGRRDGDIEGNGTLSQTIKLKDDECTKFTLNGQKNGANGNLKAVLMYKGNKYTDTLLGKGETTTLTAATSCNRL